VKDKAFTVPYQTVKVRSGRERPCVSLPCAPHFLPFGNCCPLCMLYCGQPEPDKGKFNLLTALRSQHSWRKVAVESFLFAIIGFSAEFNV